MSGCHKHYYCGETTCDHGHTHGFKGNTSYAPTGVPHKHYIKCYTTKDDGHRHYYMLETSINYPLANGEHIHYINGPTQVAHQHIHYMRQTTSAD